MHLKGMFNSATNKQRTLKQKITSHLRISQNIYSQMSIEIGKRLLEERLKLGLNKAQMARIGGVVDSAYKNYEEGIRAADTNFLSAIAAAGADVLYILTGVKNTQEKTQKPPINYAILNKKKVDKLMDELNAEQQNEVIKIMEEKKQLNECQIELEEFKKRVG